jgi:hypothetical protein
VSSQHDRWLANYHASSETAYCQDASCPNAEGIAVYYEEEYGQGWTTPEDCPICNGPLGFDAPEATDDEEEDEDDDSN